MLEKSAPGLHSREISCVVVDNLEFDFALYHFRAVLVIRDHLCLVAEARASAPALISAMT